MNGIKENPIVLPPDLILKGYTDRDWETRRKILETRMQRIAGLSFFDSDYELLADYMEELGESE